MMLLALVLTVVGATSAMGQKIYQAELDKSMFKAWDGYGADAKEVAEPEAIDDGAATFGCEMNLYKSLAAGNVVFGNTNVYYLWYADLTGTKTIYAEGTPGMQLRILMNRPEPDMAAENPDAHGGATVERMLTIGDDGKGSIDVSDLAFVHLNCVKLGWGSPAGVVKAFLIEGTVKPVTGILSMINNGDAEGTDLSSFPVSFDGPHNGDSAPDKPEIVSGGVDGSKCFKVVSNSEPSETWHTQLFIYSDEVLPKGTKWKLKMSVKGDQPARITTSAQGQPRAWKGNMGIDEIGVTTQWQDYTWSGEIGVDDFQSIAFDLSNGDEEVPTTDGSGTAKVNRGFVFYFDNIEFGIDLGEANPMNDMVCDFGADVVRVNLANTNIKELVTAAGGKTLIFPNDCAKVTLNGKEIPLVSVEGRPDGNLYFFMLEDEAYDKDEVTVAFKNPEDAEHKILFTAGKWEGEAMPEFSGLTCVYADELMEGEIYSYLWAAPQLTEADPEVGSFTLDGNMKEFKVTFNQKVEVKSVEATLGSEKLTPSAADEFSKVVTLTRSGSDVLSGVKTLTITKANGEKKNIETKDEYIEVKYSFGEMSTDAKPEVLFADNFDQDGKNNYVPAGWVVNSDAEEREEGDYGSGCRVIVGGANENMGFTKAIMYICSRGVSGDVEVPGRAYYSGTEEEKLFLTARPYTLSLDAARWDQDATARQLKVQVCTEEGEVIAEMTKAVEPVYKTSTESTHFVLDFTVETEGNYVLQFIPVGMDGNPNGYGDANAIGNIKLEFIPDVMGIVETEALAAALQKAKETRDNNSDERYAGGAFTALDNLIKEYDGKKMTAPSAYTKVTSDLNDAVKALNDHVTLCNNYDKLPNEAFDLYMEKKDGKFNTTEYFTNLKAAVMKYCTITNGTQVDEETGEETTGEMLESFKLFYDDAELTAAYDELSSVINMASKMLTEEKSRNVYNYVTTGYAALHERLRRGVELLKSLGVSEDEEVIVNAEAELGDNDDFAQAIVNRASLEILKDLASGDSQLFATSVDDDTMEETSPSYDLSVFAKNPNIYGPAYSIEAPGWTKVEGNSYAWSSWDGAQNHSEKTPYPEDCSIHAGWHPNPAVITEQTIENLPAGIYTIKIQCSDNNSPVSDGTYAFVKVTDTPEVEEGEEPDPEVNYAGYVTGDGEIEGIEVLDGKLTVGFRYGTGSQAFLNDVEIWMTSPISGHDYTKEYQEVLSGVEAAKATAKVRAIEIYDLNGKRIPAAKKGVVIVKKIMSDGTVKTEKAIK